MKHRDGDEVYKRYIDRCMQDIKEDMDPRELRAFVEMDDHARTFADALLDMVGNPVNQRDALEALIPKLQKELDSLKADGNEHAFGVLLTLGERYRKSKAAYRAIPGIE